MVVVEVGGGGGGLVNVVVVEAVVVVLGSQKARGARQVETDAGEGVDPLPFPTHS